MRKYRRIGGSGDAILNSVIGAGNRDTAAASLLGCPATPGITVEGPGASM